MVDNFVENYENFSDEELAELIINGEYEPLQVIIKRYMPLINYYAAKFSSVGEKEDMVQNAVFALYSAIKSYDKGKSSFSPFAAMCIKRSFINDFKSFSRRKNIPSNLVTSINEVDVNDENDPEKIVIDNENLKNLEETIRFELSAFEYRVLNAFLQCRNYSAIADRLGVSVKSVDNALRRIRVKLSSKRK